MLRFLSSKCSPLKPLRLDLIAALLTFGAGWCFRAGCYFVFQGVGCYSVHCKMFGTIRMASAN